MPGRRFSRLRVQNVPAFAFCSRAAQSAVFEKDSFRRALRAPGSSDADRPTLLPRAQDGGVADGHGRTCPGMNQGSFYAPVGKDGKRSVQGVTFADAAQVKVQVGCALPRLSFRQADPETIAAGFNFKSRWLVNMPRFLPRRKGRRFLRLLPSAAPGFEARPKIDIKGAGRLRPDMLGGYEAFIGFQADSHKLPRPQSVNLADLTRGVEAAEKVLEAINLPEDGASCLAGITLLGIRNDHFKSRPHGFMGEAVAVRV